MSKAMVSELQTQRFEIKYLIPESLSEEVRDYVRPYLALDEYAGEDYSYEIHNIYLDSDALATYEATINGDKDRFKLRVRYYDDSENGPVFVEVKRRLNEVIRKSRCQLRRQDLSAFLGGQLPPRSTVSSEQDWRNLEDFYGLMQTLGARPKSHVAYRREAWVSTENNSFRVTMDRQVRSEPYFESLPKTWMKDPLVVFGEDVVLELKFVNRFPDWMRDLVRSFNLSRSGGAKYAGGIRQKGEKHFREGGVSETPLNGPDPEDLRDA
jgi:hypothetical protein